jgi:multiple sugar transport system substrate-binding protein
MSFMRTRGLRLVVPVAIAALAMGGCGSSPAKPTPSPTSTRSASPSNAAATTVVRWFVGLGKGNNAAQVDAEKAFVSDYNAKQKRIYINLEIVPAAAANQTLKSEIADGVPPDIVGPLGVADRNGYGGAFLDLSGEVARTQYDMTRFPAAVVDFFKDPKEGLIGLPYLINPGFIFYNRDIFNKLGLPDLPKKVGDQWNGQDWTWDAVAGLAAKLTVDLKGKKSTDAGFDPNNIVQYGFDFQWSDARRTASCFAPGTFLGNGDTAVISDAWKAAWTWYYDAMWKTHIAPITKVVNSPLLGKGSTVASGHVAMAASWTWAISTYGQQGPDGKAIVNFASWDIGVMPSYLGKTSSPMDADTFEIMKTTAHPDEAFQAMVAIMADKTLQTVYGGMPAAGTEQTAWFDQFDKYLARLFPTTHVSWSVLQEMENYPSNPSPESDLPNVQKVNALANTFYARLQSTAGLTVPNEITNLQNGIQRLFDQASASPSR